MNILFACTLMQSIFRIRLLNPCFLSSTGDDFALRRSFWSSRRRLNNFRLCSSVCSHHEAEKRSGNQSSLHTLISRGRDLLARLRSTVKFNACYLMELSRNRFPMYASVWKAKIRKIAANFAQHSPGKPSGSMLVLAENRKKGIVREMSPGNVY